MMEMLIRMDWDRLDVLHMLEKYIRREEDIYKESAREDHMNVLAMLEW